MLTVYGDIRSGNCLKVKWLLEWLRRDYRWVEVDIMNGGSRGAEFLAINPSGQVPTLVLEDGRPLAQSNAILMYLGEATELIPRDVYDRARMAEWLFWEQYSHEPYIAVARFQRVYLGRAQTEVEPRLMQRGDAALDRLEEALEGRAWLVGEAMTIADIALVAYTRMAADGGFALESRPHVRRWIAAVETALGLEPYA